MHRYLYIFILLFVAVQAFAIDKGLQIFRVGTGPSAGGSYFIGIQLAGFISKPAGSLSCEQSGLCGVPGLIASTQTQSGFIDGVRALRSGDLEALLIPADIAYAAYQGDGLFAAHSPYRDLRAFAALKPELLHIIVRSDKGIESLEDFRGKRISLGWAQSGMPSLAEAILSLYDITTNDITGVYWDVNDSLDALADDRLDAAFLMESDSAENVRQLFAGEDVALLALRVNDLLGLQIHSPSIDTAMIPAESYGNNEIMATLSVDLLWLTRADIDRDLIEKITRALWNDERSSEFLKLSHLSRSERAIFHLKKGTMDGIPLHDGARNYFNKLARLKGDATN